MCFQKKRNKSRRLSVLFIVQHSAAIFTRRDLKRWQEKGKGIKLSDATEDCLSNLRFADDVLLFSTSLNKLRDMLCEFKISTEAVGLGIHPDKTKILSNQDKIKASEMKLTISRLKSCKKRSVRDILDRRLRSKIKKRKKSKKD